MSDWTLFSNHGHVLVCLARDREARLRDVAGDVGITERAVQKIVHELEQAGFISIHKHGRCNRYEINTRKNLRHALETECTVGRLLQLFPKPPVRAGGRRAKEPLPSEPVADKKPPSPLTPIPAAGEASKPPPEPQAAAVAVKKPAGESKKSAEKDEPPNSRHQGSLF